MANADTLSSSDKEPRGPDEQHFLRTSLSSVFSYGLSAVGAGLCALLAVLEGPSPLFLVLVVLVVIWDAFRLWAKDGRLGHRAVVRSLLAAAVGLSFIRGETENASVWVAAAAGVVITAPIFVESLLAKGTNAKETFAAHLPGIRTYAPIDGVDRPLVTGSEAAIALGAVLSVTGSGPTPWLVVGVVLGLAYSATAITAFVRIRRNTEAKARLGQTVRDYAPEFYIYTSRPDDASYQIRMWLPYLERTGKRFAIITRHNLPAKVLLEHSEAPVITCPKSADLEQLLVPSLGAVFYVNASSGNGEMIRHQEYTHVYLGHGDSDKPPSYNPTHAMYDKIFAAGQAATERYGAHGVTIVPSKFEIVGRPQLEEVEVVTELPSASAESTVLYAPTWRGHVEETMLYSLPTAPAMIRALLARGVTIVFRPHPFSYEFSDDTETIREIHQILADDARTSGRRHVFGAAAEAEIDVIECMNLSDAMISDVSSVVSDYLYSGKPFAMSAVSASGDDFVAEYPIARAAYVLNGDLSNLDATLDDILVDDPMRQIRLNYRGYYLGQFPDDGYADNFISAATRMAENVENQYLGDDEPMATDSELDDEAKSSETELADATDAEDVATNYPTTTVPTGEVLKLVYRKFGGSTLLPAVLSALVFLLAAVHASPVLTGIVGIAGCLVFLVVHRSRFKTQSRLAGILRNANAPRAILVLSLAVYWTQQYGRTWEILASFVILVTTIVLETSLSKAWRVTGLEARNLPNAETRGFQPVSRGAVAIGTVAVTLVGWFLAIFGVAEIVIFILSLLPLFLGTFLLIEGIRRGLRSLRLDRRLPQILEQYDAEFAVYFGSNVGVAYQLGMWLPYLERIGRKYIVVTRSLSMMRSAGQLTDAPVINRPTLRSLEDIITPSLGVAFYVNNAGKNTHFIERREMTHVWLNHGDSEKPACYNPVHAIYDYIFSAGQAGVDRYARHGVEIPLEKFQIVGRPQVEQIDRESAPISSITKKTVLYAPTWKGAYEDSALYSLPFGVQIVRELIRRGCTVIFRSHPLNYRYEEAVEHLTDIQEVLADDSRRFGRDHIWGAAAESEMSTEDCFNASDAMISDVSAVVTDYLQSNKPLSIVSVGRTVEALSSEVPASKAAYVLKQDLSNLSEVMDELLENDTMRAERETMRKYYLGDLPTETYADAFLDTARRLITVGQVR